MPTQILIVDDDAPFLEVLVDIVEAAGYRCATATSLALAREVLQGGRVGVALIDLALVHEQGIDLVPLVRAQSPNAATILMSGLDEVELALAGHASGADFTIRKPFNAQLLVRVLGAAYRASQGRSRLVTHEDSDGDTLSWTRRSS